MSQTKQEPPMETKARKSLYYREGKSDKVYTVELRSAEKGKAEVYGVYGRRGGHMTAKAKTSKPVPLAEAERIFQSVLREKLAEGYREGEETVAGEIPEAAPERGVDSGAKPPDHMLLNAIEEVDAQKLLRDDAWLMQPKFDGLRARIEKLGTKVYALSRTNKPVTLPKALCDELLQHPRDLILDGEKVGDTYICFDVLRDGPIAAPGQELWRRSAEDRARYVSNLFRDGDNVMPVVTAYTSLDKRKLYATVHAEGLEGVVFKRKDAPYSAGRPNTGGVGLKYKFWNTCSVIVGAQRGDKSSVDMFLVDGTSIGSVTIPPNKPIPARGAIAEIRYLYRHDVGGDLVQAVYLGIRTDILAKDCTAAQLQVKGAARAK